MSKTDPYEPVRVKRSTKQRLINDCKEEFLSHHPGMKHMTLSQDFLMNNVIDFYLKEE